MGERGRKKAKRSAIFSRVLFDPGWGTKPAWNCISRIDLLWKAEHYFAIPLRQDDYRRRSPIT